MHRASALVQAATLLALVIWGICLSGTLPDYHHIQIATPDEELYREIVNGVRAGRNYYDVVAATLPEARSIFNFRLPTYAWLLAWLPDPDWAQVIFLVFSLLVTAVSTPVLLAGLPGWTWPAALVWILGASFAWGFFSDIYLTTEPWAGLFLLASIAAYARERWFLGACLGMGALLLRELALPYLFISAAFAWKEKRWTELALWLVAFGAFAAALVWHFEAVRARLPLGDASHVGQWLQFPGYRFSLLTARMCIFLWLAPVWVAALVAPFAFLGLWGWRGPGGGRLGATVFSFVLAFCVLNGGPYWGLLYCPLLGFGIANAPLAFVNLCRAAVGPSSPASAHGSEA